MAGRVAPPEVAINSNSSPQRGGEVFEVRRLKRTGTTGKGSPGGACPESAMRRKSRGTRPRRPGSGARAGIDRY